MKKINFSKWILLVVLSIVTFSCSKEDKNEEPDELTDVAHNIIGKWLLASSDAENWATYEFTETCRLNVEMTQNGHFITGFGFYSVDESKGTVIGSYTNDRGKTSYVDWLVKDSKAFQINYDLYDNQDYVGESSIYRLLANIQVEVGDSMTPDYRGYTGQKSNTGFRSLNNDIVAVDELTGEIVGEKEGVTFVLFNTSEGTAVLKIEVIEGVKTLSELIVGTWIYDYRVDHEWQRTIFNSDGTISVEWGLDNNALIGGYAEGTYTVSDDKLILKTKATDGTLFDQEWRIEEMNYFDCSYSCYNSGTFVGKYIGQRMLQSVVLSPRGTNMPDYQALVGTAQIQDYKSHNEKVAKVSDNGEITAVAKGRTYIDVNTNKGSGVIEVNVDD